MQLEQLPFIERELDNALRVVCVPRPALHTAAVSLHLRVGPRFENPRSNGRSHFVEHMLFRGTRRFASAHEQALALERLGGTLYAATHTDHGVMSLSLPVGTLPEAVAIFGEIVREPRFSDIEVERGIIREEILESLDEHGHQVDPDNLSRALIYGPHGLGLTITGTLQTMESIGLEDLHEHHARHYTGSNAVLCFAGAIDPEQCLQLAHEHLGAMPKGQRVPIEPAPRDQKTPRFKCVSNQSSQTDLRLAFRAPGENDAAEPAAEVLVRLLDDGMSTRLYARICDEKGLCYDVSADYETFEDDGVLDLAAAVQHARAPLVMSELCALVQELAADGPTDEELQKVKKRHRWEIESLLDDASSLAAFHGLAVLAGIRARPSQRAAEIASVRREGVVGVARSIFRPENLIAVAVGLLGSAERKALTRLIGDFRARG